MNKSILAGAAMIAATAVAAPVIAWSQNPPPPPPAPPGAGGPAAEPGGPGHRHGPMAQDWRRWARNVSPQQACTDRIARRAGFVATMGFKLNLTADQKPLWDKVIAATEASQDGQRKLCDALPANAQDRDRLTALDRLHHREQVLQAQLQAVQQAEPAVQALYDKLTPEQKAILDHPFRRG